MRLLAALLLMLSLAMPQAEPASVTLRATVEAARPGDTYSYVVSYQGPEPVVVIRLPWELEIGAIRGTFANCGVEGIWPEPPHQVVLCESPEAGPETAVIEVTVKQQPCGPARLIRADADAGSGLTTWTLVRLQPDPCPTPTPSPTPEPPTWRVWLPWILQQSDAAEREEA